VYTFEIPEILASSSRPENLITQTIVHPLIPELLHWRAAKATKACQWMALIWGQLAGLIGLIVGHRKYTWRPVYFREIANQKGAQA